jgi:hypothetical protein
MKLYKPREIARQGLIKNGSNSDNEVANYQYIIQLIQGGRLKVAREYGTKSRKYYLVSEAEIKRYQSITEQ